MSEREDVLNRYYTNKKSQELVKTTILQPDEIQDKDIVKHIDNQSARDVVKKKSGYTLTMGQYTRYMEESFRGQAETLDHDRIMQKAEKVNRMGRFGAKAAFGIIGLAGILDVSNTLNENKEVKRMVNIQEQNLKRRETQEARSLKRDSHNYVDMGEIVNEMFNDRIGHYKMGNAKFQ